MLLDLSLDLLDLSRDLGRKNSLPDRDGGDGGGGRLGPPRDPDIAIVPRWGGGSVTLSPILGEGIGVYGLNQCG